VATPRNEHTEEINSTYSKNFYQEYLHAQEAFNSFSMSEAKRRNSMNDEEGALGAATSMQSPFEPALQ